MGVRALTAAGGRSEIPDLDEYHVLSPSWIEEERRYFEGTASSHFGGYWLGEPGSIRFDSWPYLEICVILTGRVAIVEPDGTRHEFGAGEAFCVDQGTAADWVTIEPSAKIFVAIESVEDGSPTAGGSHR